jgi:hypothetical protein
MGRVLDHRQAMFPRDLHYHIHVAWLPAVMYGYYGPGLRRDLLLNPGGVHEMGIELDINRNRHASEIAHHL